MPAPADHASLEARLERLLSERFDGFERSLAELRSELGELREELRRATQAVDCGTQEASENTSVADDRSGDTDEAPATEPALGSVRVERHGESGVLFQLPPPKALLDRLDAIERQIADFEQRWNAEVQRTHLRLVDPRAGPKSNDARAPPDVMRT